MRFVHQTELDDAELLRYDRFHAMPIPLPLVAPGRLGATEPRRVDPALGRTRHSRAHRARNRASRRG